MAKTNKHWSLKLYEEQPCFGLRVEGINTGVHASTNDETSHGALLVQVVINKRRFIYEERQLLTVAWMLFLSDFGEIGLQEMEQTEDARNIS